LKTELGCLLVVSCLMVAASAGAAEVPMSCEKDALCGPLVERARAHSNAGQLEEALRSYQAAYQLVLDPPLLFNVGRVQHKLGRLKEAIDAYQRFLDSGYDDPALRERTSEFLARARALLPPVTPVDKPAPPVAAPPPQKRAAPFYKRPWFLALVGSVGAGVLAAGLAGGIVASREPPSAPSGALTSHPFEP
jgi:tetratricopeptide (TPR) repeat protein